jgi:hypothetical protein
VHSAVGPWAIALCQHAQGASRCHRLPLEEESLDGGVQEQRLYTDGQIEGKGPETNSSTKF